MILELGRNSEFGSHRSHFNMATNGMSDLDKFQYLALVSRVCVELDNHLHVSDKDLAEFVIEIALQNPNQKAFLAALKQQGVEFPEHLASNLVRLVLKEHPKSLSAQKSAIQQGITVQTDLDKRDEKTKHFPGLAIANSVPIKLEITDDVYVSYLIFLNLTFASSSSLHDFFLF
jgi:hypothetical protein